MEKYLENLRSLLIKGEKNHNYSDKTEEEIIQDVSKEIDAVINIMNSDEKVVVEVDSGKTEKYKCGCGNYKKASMYSYYTFDIDGLINFIKELEVAEELPYFEVFSTIYEKLVTKSDYYYDSKLEGKEVNVISFKIHYKIEKDELCEKCKPFYDDNGNYISAGVDSLFNCQVLSHGVNTGFSGWNSDDEIINRMANLAQNPEWQICCAHKSQLIGDIGVYVMGHNTYVSNDDLYSSVNGFGDRVFEEYKRRHLITSPEEINLKIYDHTEHLVRDFKIVGIWIKEYKAKDSVFMNSVYNFTKSYNKLARQNGRKEIKIYTIKGNRRLHEDGTDFDGDLLD